jgi:UDP-N-acetylglucosamine diphosphorylase/glucosamine-1-phosphate N-acetyltransferase
VAAIRSGRATELEALRDGNAALDDLVEPRATRAVITGSWVDELWDFVRDLTARLEADIPIVAAELDLDPGEPGSEGIQTTGPHRLYIERGAVIEPYAFFDLKAGPVLVRRGATVQAFTRIVGPCVVGAGSIVGPDRIGPAFIGERCRVHGELAMAIVLGHSNKAHDGFVGHSYLGRWVNLGAGTITSNLKNTYGPVQLWTPTGVRATGLTFLGSFVGDYARTGIGTRLTTGCVVGAGANLLASIGPKYVPPFSWGDSEPFDKFGIAKFLDVAERQMARRDISLTDSARRCLTAAHTLATHS